MVLVLVPVVVVEEEEEDGGEVRLLGRLPKDGYWILVLPIID